MTEPVMKYGARKGKMNELRCRIAKATAKDIRIFPVPGADILRMYQREAETDFMIAPNPREANVLLVTGELADHLSSKAAIAFQQIPRPRVLVIAGPNQLPHLPEANIRVSLSEHFLDEVLPQIRQLLENHAWSEEAEPWEPKFLTEMVEDSNNSGGHAHHNHQHDHGNGKDKNDADDHQVHNHGYEEDHEGHKSRDQKEDGSHGNGDHGHEDHDHGNGDGHDHGDMDFMSMVAMTKDLPRAKDDLPMNRSEVYFGPFHPGLPGGLSVFMELDGDTVIKARVEGGSPSGSFKDILPVDTKHLPDLLASFNPLTPKTYRLLARKALQNALKDEHKTSFSSDEIMQLESERISSHLNWLATFAKTLGNEWLHQKAAQWHAIHRKEKAETEKLCTFLEQVRSIPYLQTKLAIGGIIPDKGLHHLSGPVAKAAGKERDMRSEDTRYGKLGWKPITRTENNALDRLRVRLEEIEQSLNLINKACKIEAERTQVDLTGSGEGGAMLESPRGILKLRIAVENGKMEQLDLKAPSKPLAALVPIITEEAELSDALVQIASLDISPWELQSKKEKVN